MRTQALMRRIHAMAGIGGVLIFIGSGFYMRFGVDVTQLPDAKHMLFVSRHIYMLGPAMVHLVLAAYAQVDAHARARGLQWVATGLLVTATVLSIYAFVHESMAGHGRSLLSSLSIYALWLGTVLHAVAPWLGRKLRGRAA